jgi:hypothetical protein
VSETAILQSTAAAAIVVVAGGLYALLLALGRLHKSRTLYIGSQLAYVALAAAAFWLAVALELAGSWKLLIIVMLLGYYLAPGAIWYLTQATHGGRDEDAGPGRRA